MPRGRDSRCVVHTQRFDEVQVTQGVQVHRRIEGINAGKLRLEEGHLIEVELEPGGYDGKGAVIISAADPDKFIVAGAIKDPDRFARRIRVAAWALFEEKIYGRFIIEHDRKTAIATIKRDTAFYR